MPTRRSLLQGIGAALGVAGVGATAGCLGSLTGTGGGVPAYAGPLYDPSTVLEETPVHGYAVYDFGAIYDIRDQLPRDMGSQLEDADENFDAFSLSEMGRLTIQGYTEAGVDDLSNSMGGSVTAGAAGMLEGSFQPDELVDLMETRMASSASGAEMEEAGSAAGHDLYTLENISGRNPPSAAMGVSSESVGMGMTFEADAEGKDALTPMLEGGGGYADTADATGLLLNAFEDPTTANGVVADLGSYLEDQMSSSDDDVEATVSGLEGVASGSTIDGEEITAKLVGAYADGETPSQDNLDGVKSRIEEQMSGGRSMTNFDVDDVETSVSGRTVTASLTQDLDDLFSGGMMGMGLTNPALIMSFPVAAVAGTFLLGIGGGMGGGMGGGGMGSQQTRMPTATFEFDYDADGGENGQGHVTIRMTSGDVLNSDNSRAVRYGIRSQGLQEWPLPVEAGDTVEMDGVPPGETIVIVWVSPDGSRTDVLQEFDIPA